MEAKTLPKKNISKGKIKKTLKNIICRPDPVCRLGLTDEQSITVERVLCKHKVDIPVFKKPHWNELKSIPKDLRPKPAPVKKVDGLVFGISETFEIIKNKQCSAVVVASDVNPQMIIQPLLESCVSAKVPAVCLNNLKKISLKYFGIHTSCLGVKSGCLLDLSKLISDIVRLHDPKQLEKEDLSKMEVTEIPKPIHTCDTQTVTSSEPVYLFRMDKRSRVFVPGEEMANSTNKFIGQDFIELGGKPDDTKVGSRAYKKMIVKRICNNSNRVKKK